MDPSDEHLAKLNDAVQRAIIAKLGYQPGAMLHVAAAVLDAIPEDYAKVDGQWHHIPDEHFVSVVQTRGDVAGIDWRMEHSLPCRVRGMKDCPVQEVWEDHLDQGGHWPASGRYKLWLEGDFLRTAVSYAHGVEEVIEDERTIHWERVDE